MEKKIIAYKGFEKDLTCLGFQYEIGKSYETEERIKCCSKGFHACKDPFNVFDYYNIFMSRFCEVELSGMFDTDLDTIKICASNIRIIRELSLEQMLKIGFEKLKTNASVKYSEKEGKCLTINESDSKIYSRVNGKRLSSNAYNAIIYSTGDNCLIFTTGESSKIYSSGYFSKIHTTEYASCIFSTGNNTSVFSNGNRSKIRSSGDNAYISTKGNNNVIVCEGKNATIIANGYNTIVKANIGCNITLTEWGMRNGDYVPISTKTEIVDGVKIKANTLYKLIDGKFTKTEHLT